MSFSDINDLSSKLTVGDLYTGEVSTEGDNSENMDISEGAKLCATEKAVDSDSKMMNNNFCYQETFDKFTKDCINDLDTEFNFKSKADGHCSCYLKNQYSKESNLKNVHNFLNLQTSPNSAMYPVVSQNSKVTVKDIDSSSLKNKDCSDIFHLEKINCLLQRETAPFHPEIAKSVQELVLEMKVLLDNLKNGMNSVNDPIILSYFTRFCIIRHYLEKILFIEFKKLNEYNIEKLNFKDYAFSIKSSALEQDKLIHSLLEQFNSCVKENKSLHDRLCILQDKLQAFGLLKPQSESKAEFKTNSGIVNQISDVGRISEDNINLDFLHNNDISSGLESLEILNKSAANLHILSMQATNFQLSLNSLNKLNDDLISRVQDQELHVKSITKQLEEAHNLLSGMKNQHRKLQSAENIVKYDLQEKRRVLNKLKQQLETTRENCNLVRIKNSKSEADWQDLRREFVQRNKQTSEESNFIDDKNEESSLIDDKVEESSLIDDKAEEISLIDVKEEKSDFHYDECTTDESCVEGNSACESDEPENICDNEVFLSNTDIESKYELKKNRLQLLEEQCQILCSNLKNNSKKGQELNYRLESCSKAIENSHSEVSKKNSFSDILKANKEYKNNQEANVKINVGVNSDVDSSLSSPEIRSFNSDSCTYISNNSTTTSTGLSFSSPALKTDELVPKILDIDCKFTFEHEIPSVDSDPLSKKLYVDCNSKANNYVQDRSYFESFEKSEECQMENSDSEEMLFHTKFNGHIRSPEIKSSETSVKSDDLQKLVAELQEEKKLLQSRCQQLEMKVGVILEKLHLKTEELKLTEAAKEQEVEALKFQLNSKVLKYERAIKEYNDNNEGLREMKQKVNDQEQLILTLEETLTEIQLAREGEKDYQWEQLEEVKMSTMKEKKMLESEILHLRSDIKDLQKKIIKLLKEKDILWKTNDRLRYLHKIQIDDRWIDDHEVSECLGCRSQFSFLLRKHHCRQCGRIFCHSCSNNWLLTPSSRRQIRVCNECYMQHMEIKTDVRRDSNVQYSGDSEDEAVVEDISINFNRSNSYSSDMHPSITDSMMSLPAMQVTNLKHRTYFTSAPELHFSLENQQVPEERSLKDPPLPCHMEVVENDISGNLLIKANEEAILPILNEVDSTAVTWSLEPPCEPIPVALIYEDTILHKSSCETDGVIHLSRPGLYKLLLDNKSRSSSVLMQYSFKANILKEPEISV